MESNQTSASFFGPLLVVVGLGPPMLLDAFVKRVHLALSGSSIRRKRHESVRSSAMNIILGRGPKR
jgi:hypothetical protein